MLKFITVAAVAVAAFTSVCMLVHAPNMALLPFTLVAPEIAHWLFLFDLMAITLAWKYWRLGTVLAVPALLIAAWPTALAMRTVQPFRLVATGNIAPETLPMNILFYRPASTGTHPAIIDIYGGAWQRGAPSSDENFNRYMAGRGYDVFAIDYRHAPAFRYPAQIDDVRAAIAYIHANAAKYGVDPNRLILCGRSAGGQLALLAAYQPDAIPVRAVISFYGPADLEGGYTDPPSPDPLNVRSVLSAYLGGTPAQVPDQYRDASPITYSNRTLPPTLLIQGGRDHIVKPGFARLLFNESRIAGNSIELVEIPWSEHAFDAVFFGLGNQIALKSIDAFLAKNQ